MIAITSNLPVVVAQRLHGVFLIWRLGALQKPHPRRSCETPSCLLAFGFAGSRLPLPRFFGSPGRIGRKVESLKGSNRSQTYPIFECIEPVYMLSIMYNVVL